MRQSLFIIIIYYCKSTLLITANLLLPTPDYSEKSVSPMTPFFQQFPFLSPRNNIGNGIFYIHLDTFYE